jgi:hypothetical protein
VLLHAGCVLFTAIAGLALYEARASRYPPQRIPALMNDCTN